MDIVEIQEQIRKRLDAMGWATVPELSASNLELIFFCLKDEELRKLIELWKAQRDSILGN